MRYLYLAVAIILLSFASAAAKSEAEVVEKIEDVTPVESKRIMRYLTIREAMLVRDISKTVMVQKIIGICDRSNQIFFDTNADGVMDVKLQCFVVERIELEE